MGICLRTSKAVGIFLWRVCRRDIPTNFCLRSVQPLSVAKEQMPTVDFILQTETSVANFLLSGSVISNDAKIESAAIY